MAQPEIAGAMPDAARANDSPKHFEALVGSSSLSQAEIAERIGVDARTFRRYLSGESRVPYPVLFTVEALVRAIRAEKASRNRKAAKSTELLGELSDLQRELETLPGASRAYQRCAADIRAITRELKRRAAN